jgi:hypothetical protein
VLEALGSLAALVFALAQAHVDLRRLALVVLPLEGFVLRWHRGFLLVFVKLQVQTGFVRLVVAMPVFQLAASAFATRLQSLLRCLCDTADLLAKSSARL